MTVTSAQLLRDFAGGERAAFDAFVRREQAPLWRFCRAHVGDQAVAEEVLQETFLAAFRYADTFAGESARAWLFTIARHAAQRLGRKRSGEPRHFDDLEALGREAGWGADPDRGGRGYSAATAEHDALLAQRRRLLERALDQLDAADREIIVLRDIEGLSGPEAAEVLGCLPNAAKQRLHRARLRLMAAIRRVGGDDG